MRLRTAPKAGSSPATGLSTAPAVAMAKAVRELGCRCSYRPARAAQAEKLAVEFVAAAAAQAWLGEDDHAQPTSSTCAVPKSSPLPRCRASPSAPGGQLIQATDQWVGVKGARLPCSTMRRCAPRRSPAGCARADTRPACSRAAAAAAQTFHWRRAPSRRLLPATEPAAYLHGEAAQALAARQPAASSICGRAEPIARATSPSAIWSIRPRIGAAAADAAKTVLLVAEEPAIARLAAIDLAEAGCRDVRGLGGATRGMGGSRPGDGRDAPPSRGMRPASISCSSRPSATRARPRPPSSAPVSRLGGRLDRSARCPGTRRLPHCLGGTGTRLASAP